MNTSLPKASSSFSRKGYACFGRDWQLSAYFNMGSKVLYLTKVLENFIKGTAIRASILSAIRIVLNPPDHFKYMFLSNYVNELLCVHSFHCLFKFLLINHEISIRADNRM